MPHASLKLIPGVDDLKTQALNEAAVSESNLLRFLPDRNGLGLGQKLGGWVPFYPNNVGTVVRELTAWQDLNENKWLAVGGLDTLSVINNGTRPIITPEEKVSQIVPNCSITVGTNIVTIVDQGQDINLGDVVWIKTPISIGGGVISGLYPVTGRIDIDTYQITVDFVATSTVLNGGDLIVFSTVDGSPDINVHLANHGYAEGDYVAFLRPTNVGGLVVQNEYRISLVIDADNFVIIGNYQATSSETTMNSVFLIGEGTENGNFIITEDTNPLLRNRGLLFTTPQAYFYYYLNQGVYAQGGGFGRSGYGRGGYGTGGQQGSLNRNGVPITAIDWSLTNFGQYLVASPYNGPIYIWSPDGGRRTATILPHAPIVNAGMFVTMPQRQIVAYGSSFNGAPSPLMIRWSDVGEPDVWRATATNQAGSYELPEGSLVVAGIQAAQQAIFWTDESIWSMQYIGPPYVYAFNKIGEGVGAISPKSVGVLNNVVYWMSPTQFNLLSNNGVQTIACPVWDVIFQNFNTGVDENGIPYSYRIRCATNSQFGEVTWYFPSEGSTENDMYVKYNTQLQQWDYGYLGRSAWIDNSVLGPPIGAGTNPTYIYQHEIGNDAYLGPTLQPMLTSMKTGYFEMSDGDQLLFIDQIWPDMKWGDYGGTQNATVNFTFYGTNYPGDTPTIYGPYSVTKSTQYISTRIRNRLISFEISSTDVGTFWRVGNIRYRYQSDGKF